MTPPIEMTPETRGDEPRDEDAVEFSGPADCGDRRAKAGDLVEVQEICARLDDRGAAVPFDRRECA
jgi:hypothetical protein